MNDYGRNLIRITKTKEQAEHDRENPFMLCECPECNKSLPIIPEDYKTTIRGLNHQCITIRTKKVDHFCTDLLYVWLVSYHKNVFADKYCCLSCGAEWESGRYKCNVSMATEILAATAIDNSRK